MKRIPVIIMILTMLVSQQVLSQVITKSVIGSCGQTQSSEGNKVSWSVGEPVIGTMTGGGHQLGNGFLPSLDFSLLIVPEKENTSFIEVYPNPASELIKFKSDLPGQLIVRISSINGKEIFNTEINSADNLNVSFLTQGLYLMRITDVKTNRINTYRITISR